MTPNWAGLELYSIFPDPLHCGQAFEELDEEELERVEELEDVEEDDVLVVPVGATMGISKEVPISV